VASFFPAGHDRGVTVAVLGFRVRMVRLGSGGRPSTVTGAGAGLCLLVFGLATLLIGGRAPAAANEPVPR